MRGFALSVLASVASGAFVAACARTSSDLLPDASTAPVHVADATPPTASASATIPPVPRRTPSGPIHHVVLITIDGMLPDVYEDADAHGLRVPNLRRIAAHGAASEGVPPVFPSVTYPAHTTMSTGVSPIAHGITSNLTFDPLEADLGGWRWYAEDIQRDPIWVVAERAGYATALVYWPVSVGAKVTWLVPEYWRAKDTNDQKLHRVVSTPGLLEAVAAEHPDFWARYTPSRVSDSAIADIATRIVSTGRPTLLQIHFVQVDTAQHHFGIWSPEASAAIDADDEQLGRILDQLDKSGMGDDTDVIVASDHGFMNVTRTVKPGVLLREAGFVTVSPVDKVTDWKATVVVNGAQTYLYLRDPTDKATADALRSMFSARMHDPEGGIGRIYESDEIKTLGGDPAAFLALEATPGWDFGGGYVGASVAPAVGHGNHGYDPRRPEMRASLLMAGPGIPCGTIVGARLVDLAPTIASWLGLSMPGVEGTPLQVRRSFLQKGCGTWK